MPRVPRPEEMPRAALEPATNPAQINVGVASRIGESGRAMGKAVQDIGNAFGEVVGRIGQAQDASNHANAQLEWLKGDAAIQDDIKANVGEDGALWQDAPKRYDTLNQDIATKYPIGDATKRQNFEQWKEKSTWTRGRSAALEYQGAARNQFVTGFDQDVAGLEDRISRGEVDPVMFNDHYGALTTKLQGMNRTVLSESEVQQKTRELQARLVGSIDRHLAEKNPEERANFWGQVRGGRYELDQPGFSQNGKPGAFNPQGLGSVSAKYESGGRGVGFISSGRDDPGGKSYGVHQLSGAYSMGAFLRSPEGAKYAPEFGGARPQSDAFNATYKKIAARDPEGFEAAQKEFYSRTHYEPVRQFAEKQGFDTTNRGVQEALFSMGVQHGGAKSIVARASANGSPEAQIRSLYSARTSYVQNLSSLPSNTKASVLNRYRSEQNDALRLASQTATAPASSPAVAEPTKQPDAPTASGDDAGADVPPPRAEAAPEASGETKVAALGGTATDASPGPANDNADAQPAVDPNDPAGSYDAPAPGAPGQAKGQAAQPAAGAPVPPIPMGRLVPGQMFTVKTAKGDIQVPSEWLNAIGPKQREQFVRQSGEAYRTWERGRQSVAKGMIEDGEVNVAIHGNPGTNYDQATVRAAFSKNPEELRKHGQRMSIAKAMHDETANFANMPSDEIAMKMGDLETKYLAEGSTDASTKKIMDLVTKKTDALLKQRDRDPAGSVEGSQEVKSVREKLIGGNPRNKLDAIALMDARMQAQIRLDIPEQQRSPISQREAMALAPNLRGLSAGDALESIQKMHDKVKVQYGDKYSGVIVNKVIETTIREKQKRESFGAMLKELDEEGKVSPTTVDRMRNLEELGRREKELAPAPKPKPESKGVMSRLMGMLPQRDPNKPQAYDMVPGDRDGSDSMGAPPAKVYPTPDPRLDVGRLKKDPASIRHFEEVFGEGSAEKAVPGIKRMLKLQGIDPR